MTAILPSATAGQYIKDVFDKLDRDVKVFRLDMLTVEYHDSFFTRGQTRPLFVASRDEWVARFRDLVGPEGHAFRGRPGPGNVIRLWRGTQHAEHKDGLSWTARKSVASDYASQGDAPGQLWRIDSVPMHAILRYDGIGRVLSEFLVDTTGLTIVQEDL
ncbi:hypothetical protein [Glaciihabitans sp. UYNi722]|uniref:hypothetical protein n=1 Tax=Glaciihabitans sp. UYNi722 TaxID=3156344 RepID=UPI0033926B00